MRQQEGLSKKGKIKEEKRGEGGGLTRVRRFERETKGE